MGYYSWMYSFFFFLVLIPFFCNTFTAKKVSNFLVVGHGPRGINIIKNVGLLFSAAGIKYRFYCVSLHIRIWVLSHFHCDFLEWWWSEFKDRALISKAMLEQICRVSVMLIVLCLLSCLLNGRKGNGKENEIAGTFLASALLNILLF